MRTTLLLFALMVATLASSAAASVFDDAAAWWKLDYADSGEVTSAAQIVDASSYGRNATSISYSSSTPEWELGWTTVPAFGPGGLPAVGPEQRGLRFQPVVTGPNTSGTDKVSTGVFASNFSVSGSATFLTRLTWDGRVTDDNTWAWLANNGLNTGMGWLLGLSNSNKLSYYVASGTGASTATTIATDTWYDLAMVLNDDDGDGTGTVTFYLVPEGGPMIVETFSNRSIRSTSSPSIRIGSESGGEGTGNNTKAFSGVVDYIALWDRALSAKEVREAMLVPEPSTFSLAAGLLVAGVFWWRRR